MAHPYVFTGPGLYKTRRGDIVKATLNLEQAFDGLAVLVYRPVYGEEGTFRSHPSYTTGVCGTLYPKRHRHYSGYPDNTRECPDDLVERIA